MQKIFFSLIAMCLSIVVFAQQTGSGVVVSSEFTVTKPLQEIFALTLPDKEDVMIKESKDRANREPTKFLKTPADGPEYANAPQSMQTEMGDIDAIDQKASWAGGTASGFRPFDPSGAAGPNHYVQMINSTTFRIFTKTGSLQMTGTLGNLWSPAVGNSGDPIVLYDKAADRWLLAQFGNTTDRKIYIAISTSPDPMGSYYTYTYVSPQFPDYLKFSIWQDGYYMTSNQSTQKVFAFDRSAMLVGTPGARAVYVTYSPPKSGFFCPLAGDAGDGVLPPAGTPCPIMSYSDNGWGTGFFDRVNIYNMSVNWVPTTPTATITLAANVSTQAFDASYNAQWNDVSQPGTNKKLDGIGGVLMYRAQWKSWSGYNSVVLNWAVKISNSQRSIKWAELRQNQTTGVWSMYQEGIYTPDAATRWMGSIAMDDNGSIGLSYIKSHKSGSIYPGLFYTGRRSCDPLGTLPVTEVLVKAGTGSQTNTNRVGDYAHTALDPDGVTFWTTSEYMGGTTGSSAARTHIFSYQITPCGSGLVKANTDKTIKGDQIHESISHVQLGDIDNHSPNSKYSNYTSMSTELNQGNTYPLNIMLQNAFTSDKVKVWIDWNNDNQFELTEEVYTSAVGIGPFNTNLTIPNTAKLGTYTMRIKLFDSKLNPNVDASNTIEFGEVEDYSIVVTEAQTDKTTIAVQDESKSQVVTTVNLEVFPNPSIGTINISSDSEGMYYMINETGKLVEQFNLNAANNYSHTVNNVLPGFYTISGHNKNGISKQKVIVNK